MVQVMRGGDDHRVKLKVKQRPVIPGRVPEPECLLHARQDHAVRAADRGEFHVVAGGEDGEVVSGGPPARADGPDPQPGGHSATAASPVSSQAGSPLPAWLTASWPRAVIRSRCPYSG